MIIVDTRGGLANRMQAVDSARSLAQELGRPLSIPWIVNNLCGARFDELFEDADRIGEFRYFKREKDAEAFLEGHRRTLVVDHNLQPFCDIPNAEMATSLGDIRELQKHPVVIIRSWARFYRSAVPFGVFKPIEPLRCRISRITQGFHATVGVHIRRTDHLDSIRESPTTAFITLMREALDAGDVANFFLATDDPTEEARLRKLFPIVTCPKRSLARGRVDAVQDAVVDLFCLAATRRIIGSAGSTFSNVASEISGIPLRIAGWQ